MEGGRWVLVVKGVGCVGINCIGGVVGWEFVLIGGWRLG